MTMKAKRILLAEDEVALRDFVSRNLRVRGFEVL
jgi:two-component system, OmpR family, KDP operon response regulator KdpE